MMKPLVWGGAITVVESFIFPMFGKGAWAVRPSLRSLTMGPHRLCGF